MTRGSRLPAAAHLLQTRSGGNRQLVFRPACSYYSCDMNYIVILLAGVLLTGCTTALTPKTLTSSEDGQTVSVKLGQVLAVSLPSNRTTGYGWVERAPSESVLERDGEPTYAQDAASAKRVGGGGIETWRFRATKVGRQTLRLEYVRPWETNVAPAKVINFQVVGSAK